MNLTDRYTRLLLGTLTLGALLVPATVAGAEPPEDEKAPPPPCQDDCPPDPNPECPEWGLSEECPVIVCYVDDPECPDDEPECPGDEDCPVLCVEDDPDCPPPGEDNDPDPEEPIDPSVPAYPTFTG
jgi:hypothetical protein